MHTFQDYHGMLCGVIRIMSYMQEVSFIGEIVLEL
jgi:hypothetical protein